MIFDSIPSLFKILYVIVRSSGCVRGYINVGGVNGKIPWMNKVIPGNISHGSVNSGVSRLIVNKGDVVTELP